MFSFSLHGSWPAPARVGARSPLEKNPNNFSMFKAQFSHNGWHFLFMDPFSSCEVPFSIYETESGCMMGAGGCIVGDAQRYTNASHSISM